MKDEAQKTEEAIQRATSREVERQLLRIVMASVEPFQETLRKSLLENDLVTGFIRDRKISLSSLAVDICRARARQLESDIRGDGYHNV